MNGDRHGVRNTNTSCTTICCETDTKSGNFDRVCRNHSVMEILQITTSQVADSMSHQPVQQFTRTKTALPIRQDKIKRDNLKDDKKQDNTLQDELKKR